MTDGENFFLSDSRRDAERYHHLVLALSQISAPAIGDELRQMSGIDAVLKIILPHLAEALNCKDTFVAQFIHGGLEVVAANPDRGLRGALLPTGNLPSLLLEPGSKVVAPVVMNEGHLGLSDLAAFGAASAVLARVSIAGQVRLVGACTRVDDSLGSFINADRMALESILELIALGISAGERRRSELEEIQRVLAEVNTGRSLTELLSLVAEGAGRVFSAPVALLLWDEKQKKLRIRASQGLSGAFVHRHEIPPEKLRAIVERLGADTAITLNLRADPPVALDLIETEGLFSVLVTRLQVGNDLIGALAIYSKMPNEGFSRDQIELAEIFTRPVAMAIHGARMRQNALQGILFTSETALTTHDYRGMLKLIVSRVAEIHAAPRAFLALPDRTDILRIEAAHGELARSGDHAFKMTHNELTSLISRFGGTPFVLDRTHPSFHLVDPSPATPTGSVLCIPLAVADGPGGLLVVMYEEPRQPLGEEEAELARILGGQVGMALRAARLNRDGEEYLATLERLLETARSILSLKDERNGLQILADAIVADLNVTFCVMLIYDQERRLYLEEAASPVSRKGAPLQWKFQIGRKIDQGEKGLLEDLNELTEPCVFRSGEPWHGMDVVEHIRAKLNLISLKSVLVVSLKSPDKNLGICVIGEMRSGGIDENKTRRAELFAAQGASFIRQLQLQGETALRAGREKDLREAGELLGHKVAVGFPALTDQAARLACEKFGADNAVVYPYHAALDVFDIHAVGLHGVTKPKMVKPKRRAGQSGITDYLLHSEPLLVVEDVTSGWDRERRLVIQPDRKADSFINREKVRSFIGLRLQVGGETVGLFYLNWLTPRAFTEGEISSLSILAGQAGAAIARARLFQRGDKAHQAIEAARHLAHLIGRATSHKESWRWLLQKAIEITHAERGQVLLDDLEDQAFTPQVRIGYRDRWNPREASNAALIDWLRAEGLPPARVENGTPEQAAHADVLLVLDTAASPEGRLTPLAQARPARRSLLAAWFRSEKGLPVGVMVLEHADTAAFGPDDQEILGDLAAYLGIGLQAAQRSAEIHKINRLQRGILDAGEKMAALRPLDELLDSIVRSTRAALDCDLVTLYTYQEKRKKIDFPPHRDGPLLQPKAIGQHGFVEPQSLNGVLLRSGKACFADKALDHPVMSRGGFVWREKIVSSAGIPLLFGAERVGILFANYRQLHHFSTQEKSTIHLYAAQAAAAIHNARLYEEVKQKQRHLEAVQSAGKIITDSVGLEHRTIYERMLQAAVEKISGIKTPKASLGTIWKVVAADRLDLECTYPPSQGWSIPLRLDREPGSGNHVQGDPRWVAAFQAADEGKVIPIPDLHAANPALSAFNFPRAQLAVPLVDNGRAVAVCMLESSQVEAFDEHDITALHSLFELGVIALNNARRAEQLSRANMVAIMGVWGADISHDLNREVSNIRWAVSAILAGCDPGSEIANKARAIDAAAEELAMPVFPQQKISPGMILPKQFISAIDKVISVELNARRDKLCEVKFEYIPAGDGAAAHIAPQWLRRILRHLINNAAQAFPPAQTERTVTVRASAGEQVEVRVIDNGPGVPEDVKARLFKEPIVHEDGRVGSGLLLVQFLVEQHGGQVCLESSRPGEGSCFLLTLIKADQEKF